MIISAIAGVSGFASALADRAVDGYRARVQAQVEDRRLAAVQLNVLVSSFVAVVGMVTDVVSMQLRAASLQEALEEATGAGDLERAEQLRGQLVQVLQTEPASARLLSTLAEYLPALLTRGGGPDAKVIEGQVL